VLRCFQQIRQLGDIGRNPPRFITREQAGGDLSLPWPFLQHAGPLPDGQPDARPVLHRPGEDFLRASEVVPA
jgi:hypothetical protein